jgi:hypothetical protein
MDKLEEFSKRGLCASQYLSAVSKYWENVFVINVLGIQRHDVFLCFGGSTDADFSYKNLPFQCTVRKSMGGEAFVYEEFVMKRAALRTLDLY